MPDGQGGKYTPRDLLAIVVVVGLLGALVPSCLQEARTPGRRGTCQNNQHNLALAALMFAEAHRHYPGYANTVGAKTASYLVPLFPFLERNDVYQVWLPRQDPTRRKKRRSTCNCLSVHRIRRRVNKECRTLTSLTRAELTLLRPRRPQWSKPAESPPI